MDIKGTPTHVIGTSFPKLIKSPCSERRNKRVKIPESSIYANRKTKDLHLTFSTCMHIADEESSIRPIDAEETIFRIKNCAVCTIQEKMRKFFNKYHYDKESKSRVNFDSSISLV